jgi:HEAT repeat protein
MRARLVLLAGQTVALGLTVAFLVVPASALLLHAYGAGTLPFVYLAVAVSGVVVSSAMRRAQAKLSLAALSITVLAAYIVLVAAGYVVHSAAGVDWVTFPLVVLFPLAIPVGFVLVGAQAGRLLDVRQMKEYFPRVVGGFSLGFAVGGLLAAWLVHLLARTDQLLLVDLVVAGSMLALVAETARRYPDQMRTRPQPTAAPRHDDAGRRTVPLNALVLAIFGYQVLSAGVTQLLDYIVWERAAARYPDTGDLAHFQGLYGASINIVAIAFVVLLAGRLLGRFGVGLGLAANPAGVVVLLVLGNLIGWSAGVAGLVFLLVVCAQQIGDISLTDGMTRTAINATYQALPADERLRAQTMVEGAGVPLALGLVGAVLLLFRLLGLEVRAVELFSLLISVVWLVLAMVAYQQYGVELRSLVTRRAWEPAALSVPGDAGLDAVQRLLRSSDPRDVEVGLVALADSQSPTLAAQIGALLGADTPAGVRATAARASLVTGDPTPRAEVTRLLEDPDVRVRSAAAAGLVGTSGGTGDRAREVWLSLVGGEDSESVGLALRAAASSPSPFFVPHLVEAAGQPVDEAALAQALAAHAEHLGPELEHMLVDRHGSRQVRERLAHAVTAAGGRAAPVGLDLRAALAGQRTRAARARSVLARLDGSPALDPLRRALVDELDSVRDDTTTLLELVSGHRGLARAVRALDSGDSGERALALEAIEVTAGHSQARLVLDLLDPDRDADPDPVDEHQDWLRDLVEDPDGVWQEPWLRTCALYAAPTVLGAGATALAEPWLDDPDRAVAETARWVLGAGPR